MSAPEPAATARQLRFSLELSGVAAFAAGLIVGYLLAQL
jgi:hypothetical protein